MDYTHTHKYERPKVQDTVAFQDSEKEEISRTSGSSHRTYIHTHVLKDTRRELCLNFTNHNILVYTLQSLQITTMWSLRRFSTTEWSFILVGLLGGILTILQMWLLPMMDELQMEENTVINAPIILWWTSSFGEDEQYRNCGDKRCYFTKKRSNAMNPLLKAILFYGSNVEMKDLPIPRSANVRWALLHEESPRNNPMFVHQEALKLFNYSATFSRYSDLPLTLLSLPGEEELLGTNYFLPVEEKNRLLVTKKLAPVLYIQTDCDTASDRDSYVAELMKYIPVDSYGACLNNRRLPQSLSENYIEKLDSDEFLTFVGQYKFTLAFENAVCDDYITEKLWRPLIVGSVPVYYGSPTFQDWLPNNTSAIAAKDFDDPKNLANYLLKINNDDERYEEFLSHKISNPETSISNERLMTELRARPKYLNGIFGYSVRAFECLVCEKLHDTRSISRMTSKQYNCSLPRNMIIRKNNQFNSWLYQWMFEKCTAKLLVQHVSSGKKIDIDRFTKKAFKMYENNEC